MRRMLTLVFVFNAADAFLTWFWIASNRATEANPLMAHLLAQGPGWFLLGKMSLVLLGVLLLWRYRRSSLAVPSAVSAFWVYVLIVVYHIHGLHVEFLNPWLA
jgi:hypothetical protein